MEREREIANQIEASNERVAVREGVPVASTATSPCSLTGPWRRLDLGDGREDALHKVLEVPLLLEDGDLLAQARGARLLVVKRLCWLCGGAGSRLVRGWEEEEQFSGQAAKPRRDVQNQKVRVVQRGAALVRSDAWCGGTAVFVRCSARAWRNRSAKELGRALRASRELLPLLLLLLLCATCQSPAACGR